MSDRIDATPTGVAGSAADVAGAVHRVREGLPHETTAWDVDRLAGVVLDRNGTPTRVLVADRWDARATPQALARAVVDAGRAAARDLDAQARAALQKAAARRTRQPGVRTAATHAVPDAARRAPSAGTPRPLDELAEIAISSLAAASHASATEVGATLGVGRELDGDVEVTVGRGGIVAVALHGPRVAKASAAALTTLLSAAVQAAVQDLARRREHEAPAVSDELLAEVLTHLRALTADPLSASGGRVVAAHERS